MIQKRVAHARHAESLAEAAGDLARIEAQADLAWREADLLSQILESNSALSNWEVPADAAPSIIRSQVRQAE